MTIKYKPTFRSGKTRNRIADYLAKHPGATSDVIAGGLGITIASAASALTSMTDAGIVVRAPNRVGRYYAYMLSASAKQPTTLSTTTERLVLPEDPDAPGQLTLLMPTAIDPEVEQLKARLAELEAFKAEAVAKHPELVPIDYEAYRPALVTYYRVGGWDTIANQMQDGAPLTPAERQRIDGLIAAAKLFPEGAAR